MVINISTTVEIPEIPKRITIENGSLKDALLKVFSGLHFSDQVIDPTTGEIKQEGIFDILLNGVPFYSLPLGLNTELKDGDTITLSLIMLGGG
ncbi:MAG: hypothetical protein N2745_01045 [Syntrophorhabdaceae bacterium]|nr:hypothetical protein [Syntrophorhabdaceae bacterium]